MGPRRRRRPRNPFRRPRSSRPAVSSVSMAVRILTSKLLQHHSYLLLRRFHHQVYFRDIPERPNQPGIEFVLVMFLHLLESLPAAPEPPDIVLRARTPLDPGAIIDVVADPDFLRNRTDAFGLPAALAILHGFSSFFP